jgi:hypothetical protein
MVPIIFGKPHIVPSSAGFAMDQALKNALTDPFEGVIVCRMGWRSGKWGGTQGYGGERGE